MPHALDRLEPEARRALAEAKFASLVARARTGSAWWRDRLAALPSHATLADLPALPVLTKADLAVQAPPTSEAMLTVPLQEAGGAYVFRSGGTSGDPKFSLFSTAEFRDYVAVFQRTYLAAGLEPGDRVGNLFSCGSLYASFIFVNRLIEELGCLNLPFTAAADPDLVVSHLDRFGIDVLMGFPSWLVRVAERMPDRLRGRVRKLFWAGEQLTAPDEAYLRERFGAQLVASGGYGAVDTGLMGFQCPACHGGEHHAMLDHAWLEIVDPDTGAPAAEGELLVTCLDRQLMPMLRYRIGDRARWLADACPCGRTSPRYVLLGRTGDSLRIGIATVAYAEVQEALEPRLAPGCRVQLVKEREDGRDRLVVRVEHPGGAAAVPCEPLREVVLAAKPDLAKMEKGGQIAPVRVEPLGPGGLVPLAITGKVPRTVDRSQAAPAGARP